ncbi:MAG TPA: polysaccharide biosynthesis/export family protein [Usitatibacter sp.]|jgi:polysaccharide export outer membrane protein|nr:polysaccharide biosynthesis/export family protein [Usitatibacter sp.]
MALAALFGLGMAGCASAPTGARVAAPPEVMRSSVRFQKEYLLYPGDQLEVAVWRNPDVSRTVLVRPDGFISLPLLQDVQAAGLTPRELAQSITKLYSPRLLNPEVTVLPMQTRQPTVYVLGDVKNPGGYPVRSAVTAAQALAVAGGVLRTGGESDATVIRLNDEGYLEAIPIGGGMSFSQAGPFMSLAAVLLKPDDIVFIPETGRAQFVRGLQDLLVPYQIYLNYRLIQYTLK